MMIKYALNEFRRYLSVWEPPGYASPQICRLCTTSPFVPAAGLEEWPHDAVHRFVWQLCLAVQRERGRMEDQYSVDSDDIDSDDVDEDGDREEIESDAERERRFAVYEKHSVHLVRHELRCHRDVIQGLLRGSIGDAVETYVSESVDHAIQVLQQHLD